MCRRQQPYLTGRIPKNHFIEYLGEKPIDRAGKLVREQIDIVYFETGLHLSVGSFEG